MNAVGSRSQNAAQTAEIAVLPSLMMASYLDRLAQPLEDVGLRSVLLTVVAIQDQVLIHFHGEEQGCCLFSLASIKQSLSPQGRGLARLAGIMRHAT